MKWWKEYIFENTDESAQHIMNAANYAGRAICITQTTAPHAFSYKITSLYGLPHGHAVAVCLPEIWTFMLQNPDLCIDKRGKDYLERIFHQIAQSMNVTTSQDAVLYFRKMMKEMSLANPVSTNIEQEVDILSHSVNPIRLKNNPVRLDEETIRCLYLGIIKE
jgi:alcohol dehydrogenase class IV